jgi:hypothetical protein
MVKKLRQRRKPLQKQKQKQKVVVNVRVGGGKEKTQQPIFMPAPSQSVGIGDVMRLIESSLGSANRMIQPERPAVYSMPQTMRFEGTQEIPPTNITQLNNLRPIRMDDIVGTTALNEPMKMESNVINQSFSLDNQLIPLKTSRGIATEPMRAQPMETQTESPQLGEMEAQTEERLNTEKAQDDLRVLAKSQGFERISAGKFKKFFVEQTGISYAIGEADRNLDLLKRALNLNVVKVGKKRVVVDTD